MKAISKIAKSTGIVVGKLENIYNELQRPISKYSISSDSSVKKMSGKYSKFCDEVLSAKRML